MVSRFSGSGVLSRCLTYGLNDFRRIEKNRYKRFPIFAFRVFNLWDNLFEREVNMLKKLTKSALGLFHRTPFFLIKQPGRKSYLEIGE